MTISREEMLENEVLAIRQIGERFVHDYIGQPIDTALFHKIYPTTWKRLVDKGYLRCTHWYALTPEGWVKALETIGELWCDETKKNLGKVCAALKGRIERTKQHATGALIGLHEIVSETGLPEYWISNVIDSRLIQVVLKRKDAYWAPLDQMKSTIEVPVDIGHPLYD